MGRYHKTSHGPRKRQLVGYSIIAIPKKYEPTLNSYGFPPGFKNYFKTKEEVKKAISKLRKTKLYRSLRIQELKA